MLSRFYQRHSALLLLLVIVSLPFLAGQANSLPQNNDIETWLPNGSSVRVDYERFKREFGVEEVILVALDRNLVSAEMTEAMCARFERLPGVRQCWSPDRMRTAMGEMGVSDEEFTSRARGLAISNDGRWHALIALLSTSGLKDRAGTVREIRRELNYCQLTGNEVLLSGGPVIVTELDRLGGQQESQKFFMITLLLCLGVLYYWLRDWKLSLCIMLLTVWAINLTLTIFKWSGGQMNFILGAFVCDGDGLHHRGVHPRPALPQRLPVRARSVAGRVAEIAQTLRDVDVDHGHWPVLCQRQRHRPRHAVRRCGGAGGRGGNADRSVVDPGCVGVDEAPDRFRR